MNLIFPFDSFNVFYLVSCPWRGRDGCVHVMVGVLCLLPIGLELSMVTKALLGGITNAHGSGHGEEDGELGLAPVGGRVLKEGGWVIVRGLIECKVANGNLANANEYLSYMLWSMFLRDTMSCQ